MSNQSIKTKKIMTTPIIKKCCVYCGVDDYKLIKTKYAYMCIKCNKIYKKMWTKIKTEIIK